MIYLDVTIESMHPMPAPTAALPAAGAGGPGGARKVLGGRCCGGGGCPLPVPGGCQRARFGQRLAGRGAGAGRGSSPDVRGPPVRAAPGAGRGRTRGTVGAPPLPHPAPAPVPAGTPPLGRRERRRVPPTGGKGGDSPHPPTPTPPVLADWLAAAVSGTRPGMSL